MSASILEQLSLWGIPYFPTWLFAKGLAGLSCLCLLLLHLFLFIGTVTHLLDMHNEGSSGMTVLITKEINDENKITNKTVSCKKRSLSFLSEYNIRSGFGFKASN